MSVDINVTESTPMMAQEEVHMNMNIGGMKMNMEVEGNFNMNN